MKQEIFRLKQENPRRSAVLIREMMMRSGDYSESDLPSVTTYQRYLVSVRKDLKLVNHEDMRAFEMAYTNQMWQIDTSHGPFLTIEGKKRKTYIVQIVDDASRLVVGSDIFFEDNALNVQTTLKHAIETYGVPDVLYADNGKPYKNKQLKLICANLGCILKHAAPYHGNMKAKIERNFGVMKQQWMYQLNYADFKTLDELKASLDAYVHKKNHTTNKSLGTNPHQRFTTDTRAPKMATTDDLDRAFLHTETRKVNNDGTISFLNYQYETGHSTIGQTITIRYYPDLSKVYMQEDDGTLTPILEVDKVANSTGKRKQVRMTEDEINDC
jgi:transposase InsO family protein